MSCLRAFFAFFLPPVAVLDKGCGSIFLVFGLTILGWVPGIFAAMLICLNDNS